MYRCAGLCGRRVGGLDVLESASVPVPTPLMLTLASQDDEIIPNAIVIKNIPFNVKRETLLDIIVRDFRLPRDLL